MNRRRIENGPRLPPGGRYLAARIAYPNFYVITRYNRSRLYASAVINLAEAIRAAR